MRRTWRKSSHSAACGDCAEVAAWRTSSHSMSNGQCAEVGAWRKSSHSVSGECAEVGQGGTVVGVRDSRDPDGPWLAFSGDEWTVFLDRLRSA
jgi:hypothetical protein